MFCPNCRTEYRAGFTRCADCGAALVDSLPPEEPPREVTPVLLAAGVDATLCPLLRQILEDNGIPSFTRTHDEIDNIRKIYTGACLFGEDIYVADADLTGARALCEAFLSPPGERRPLRGMSREIEEMDYPEETPGSGLSRELTLKYLLLGALCVAAVVLLYYLSTL